MQQQGQLQSPPVSTHWSNYDKSVADILGWLAVQDHLQKANKASVGNISDIEQLIVKQKVGGHHILIEFILNCTIIFFNIIE